MQKIRGVVERIIRKDKFSVVRIEGSNTGYFDWNKFSRDVKEGDEVEIHYEDGKYPRIRRLTKITEKKEAKQKTLPRSSETTRDDRIIRMTALKIAAELIKSAKLTTYAPVDLRELCEKMALDIEKFIKEV